MDKNLYNNSDKDCTRIPKVVVKRLAKYYSALEKYISIGEENISSQNLADEVHVKASQLRKDLAYFGEFGTRGKGYDIAYLHDKIGEILGLESEWPIILAGMGHLGYALAAYKGLGIRGFRITGIFESDIKKIGKTVHGAKVYHIDELPRVVRENSVRIGVITVPAEAAQEVCDLMIESGIEAILNFAPVNLKSNKPVFIERVDISGELSTLSHLLTYHRS
jgi:redox-sensing transcriptional repressor